MKEGSSIGHATSLGRDVVLGEDALVGYHCALGDRVRVDSGIMILPESHIAAGEDVTLEHPRAAPKPSPED
ncbi:hypothetical protein FM103_02055 [Corynebacterium xerosis]|nr:hypothetical protein FM103_02055 [Corynebacterium xerosis]